MSFLAPLFLAGALAIALPILFHLARRSTREQMPFSSLMFLKPSPPRMTRRNRVEHILLMALRCLVIALLAMGFSRPFLQKPMTARTAAPEASRTILLLDTSASMVRQNLWPEAVARAHETVAGTGPVDQLAVLAFDSQVRTLIGFEEWAAAEVRERRVLAEGRIAAERPSWRFAHLGNALLRAVEMMDDADHQDQNIGPRRIVVVSDLPTGIRLDGLQGYEWPRGIEVAFDIVSAPRTTNAGIQWVMDAGEGIGAASDIRLLVSNSSNARREQFRVRWDGLPEAGAVDVYVPPGQSRIVRPPELPEGTTGERIVLGGDDDDFDNTAYVVRSPAQVVEVLFVGEDRSDDPAQLLFYLRRAFQETSHHSVRVAGLAPGDLASASLADQRLVIVAANLPENSLHLVRGFLEEGGTVLFVMKEAGFAGTLNRLTARQDLRAVEAAVVNYSMISRIDFEHPLFAPFSDPRYSDFTGIHVWRHRRLSVETLPEGRVLASFDSGDPAIAEMPVGAGRVLVMTSSWRPADSQLALSTKFVPLLYSILEQSGAIRTRVSQFRVGEVVDLSTMSVASGGALTVRKPDAAEVQLEAGERRFIGADQPGIYEVISAHGSVRFAVNLDPGESRTAPMPIEDLERLTVPLKAAAPDPARQAEHERRLHAAELEAQQKLWRWLIVAAIVILIVETWLAGRLTRGAAARTETTA